MAGFIQNIMQLESSFYINTRKRKVSVTFDDEFDYLYEIKDNAELCLDVKKVMRGGLVEG